MNAPTLTVSSPNGAPLPGTEVKITKSEERWSEFHLENGLILRAKVSLVSVHETGESDENGNPRLMINAAPIIAVVNPAMPDKKDS